MRLDNFLAARYGSRNRAAEAIKRGEVLYGGAKVKPSREVANESLISFDLPEKKFVSRGGYKLDKALYDFKADISGKTALDIGASTGGFTDCLLQRGAKKVYAADVGEGQLDKTLAKNPKVIIIDNTNAKDLKVSMFAEPLGVITADLSFISLTKVLDVLQALSAEDTQLYLLIKPQFEAGKDSLPSSGIIKNRGQRIEILKDVLSAVSSARFNIEGLTFAPVCEGKNIEYVVWLKKGSRGQYNTELLDNLP